MANEFKARKGLLVEGNTALTGNLSVSGTFTPTGNIVGSPTITGSLTVQNDIQVNDDLVVNGDLTVNGSFAFAGGSVFPDDTFEVQDNIDSSKVMGMSLGGATPSTKTTLSFAQTANRSISFPDASTTLVGHDSTQTLTNKAIDATTNNISNLADANIAAAAGIATSKIAALTANRAVKSDASGFLTFSTVTTTELERLSGIGSTAVGISDVQTLTSKTISASNNTISGIGDTNIDSAAAIARSKLANGTNSHVVINDGAGVLSSEAQLAPLRGGTGQNFSASTGVIKVAAGTMSAASIVDADIDAAAAIAHSKLAALTASRALASDGSGAVSASTVTSTELGYVSGVTSAIQTQLGAKEPVLPLTTNGDLLTRAAGVQARVAIGSEAQVLKSIGGAPTWEDLNAVASECRLYDDFIADPTGALRWLSTASGAGAGDSMSLTNSYLNHPGVVQLTTGTTAAGRGSRNLGGSASVGNISTGFRLGGGQLVFEWRAFLTTLATVGEDYTVILGLTQNTGGVGTDGVYFNYNRAANPNNWLAVTRTASVNTVTDTGVAAVAGSWVSVRAVVNAAGTSVDFYINGALVATNTTNIPTAQHVAPFMAITKSAGTSARTVDIDVFRLHQRFTTAR